MAALPTADLPVSLILSTLGVVTAKAIFYNGSVLKTLTELGQIVRKEGLSSFCPGVDASAKLSNLLNDRRLSYFKGYEHVLT